MFSHGVSSSTRTSTFSQSHDTSTKHKPKYEVSIDMTEI